ncbi:MAG: MATE family efflux transporter [Deltaproteobacteria bacterium]|nr:MATE family efflux transporter [Deltaproteobacteria bacterium]
MILLAAVLRGVGNTRIAFFIALLTNGLNVVINSLLIHGTLGFPALGVQGAAFGTVISQGIGTLVYIAIIKCGTIAGVVLPLPLPLAPPAVDREIVGTLLRIGTPAALDMMVLNAALVSMVSMFGRIDPMAVAAHGIGLRIQGLAFLPGFSISQAIGALVGQALGAKNEKEADEVVRAGKWMASALMTSVAIVLFVFAGPIVGIFDVQPGSSLDEYAQMWMRVLSTGMPFVGYYFAIFGVLQGAGATKTSLHINANTTLFFLIPLSVFFAFVLDWGAFGVWLAFPLSYLPKSGLGWWKVRQGDCKKGASHQAPTDSSAEDSAVDLTEESAK